MWPGSGAFDAVVVAGGGVFSGPPFRHPIMQVFCLGRDPSNFDQRAVVAWHGVGLQDGCLPIADAPRVRDAQLTYLSKLAKRLDYISVRDAASIRRLVAGGSVSPTLVPDPVFALPPRFRKSRPPSRRPHIAVAVGSPVPSVQLLNTLGASALMERCPGGPPLCVPPAEAIALVTSCQEQARCQSFFLSVCLAVQELSERAKVDLLYARNIYADDQTALHIAAMVPGARMRELPATVCSLRQVAIVVDMIAEYDAIIASRYHTAILAMCGATPLVALDPYRTAGTIETKLSALTAGLGLARRYWAPGANTGDSSSELLALVADALQCEPLEITAYSSQHFRATAGFVDLAQFLRLHPRGSHA